MNSKDYKIDPNSIDEKFMLSKTRQSWEDDRFNLQSIMFQKMRIETQTVESVDLLSKEIQKIKARIDYINEVLERWYSDMCIQCGKLTIVNTYCGQPERCKHCFEAQMRRYLSQKSEEELDEILERIEKNKGD